MEEGVMRSSESSVGGTGYLRVACAMIIIMFYACAAGTALAANQVDIHARNSDDTLWNGSPTSLDIYIENDYILGGMALGFRFYSPDGATWHWDTNCDPPAVACIVPGSRADPNPFTMTGLLVTMKNTDGISPDTIMIGGVAMTGGLPTGPLEHLFSIYFTPSTIYTATLCVDSAFVPPSGAFVFVDLNGSASPPTVLWPWMGRCWAVGGHYHCWAEWDEGLPTEMAVDRCGSNSVTLSASHYYSPVRFELYQLNGGAGEATVIDNGDETCEVSYTPGPGDAGQEITIVVNADCDYCPSTNSLYNLAVNVVNHSPVLDIGSYYNWGANNNLITKNDISTLDDDDCDDHSYLLISGPGEIDPATGVYTWMPGPADIGEYYITVEVSDGIDTDQAEFMVGTHDETCCPGDANFSGTCNVGDVVFLIAYIFKGGEAPKVMNWADANADCTVNVADAVYLIAYIFKSGPPPEVGCYYSPSP